MRQVPAIVAHCLTLSVKCCISSIGTNPPYFTVKSVQSLGIKAMAESFRRWCELALGHPVTLVARLTMVAAIIFGMVACDPTTTNFGATRVATTANGVAAETLRVGRFSYIENYVSIDGGMTWRLASLRDEPRTFKWGEGQTAAPNRGYQINGADIVRVSDSNRVIQTVYSGEHLQEHVYQWVQAKSSGLHGHNELSLLPSSIVYDQSSGNLIASTGIRGILVGTPDGSWIPVAVGSYAPADFSRLGRVKTLFSTQEFWGAVLTFPLSMIALTMLITRLRQEWPVELVFVLLALGVVFVSIILSSIWIMALASASSEGGSLFVFAFISALALAGATGCAWRIRWLNQWRAIMGSLLCMMAFMTFSFVVWLQAGGHSVFAALAAILLSAASSWMLGRILMREGPKWIVMWSRD